MIADKTKAMAYYLINQEMCATRDEVELVADINGWKEDTMRDILFARTGYRDFDQLPDWDSFYLDWYEDGMAGYDE